MTNVDAYEKTGGSEVRDSGGFTGIQHPSYVTLKGSMLALQLPDIRFMNWGFTIIIGVLTIRGSHYFGVYMTGPLVWKTPD